uniref:Uncharacterized protein n=1 Tax=Chlamydomonas euryale TaxID=1486919 RepID=A0A7R9V2R7_9CHLO
MARDNGLLYEPTAPRAPAVAPLAVAASSVHGNNGLAARMMRRAKRASSRRRVRGATAVRPAHVGGASGATYPPPVLGAAGGISFSDFDANSWEVFKAEVLRRIDACIASGCWRKDAVSPQGGIATSCPRF